MFTRALTLQILLTLKLLGFHQASIAMLSLTGCV